MPISVLFFVGRRLRPVAGAGALGKHCDPGFQVDTRFEVALALAVLVDALMSRGRGGRPAGAGPL